MSALQVPAIFSSACKTQPPVPPRRTPCQTWLSPEPADHSLQPLFCLHPGAWHPGATGGACSGCESGDRVPLVEFLRFHSSMEPPLERRSCPRLEHREKLVVIPRKLVSVRLALKPNNVAMAPELRGQNVLLPRCPDISCPCLKAPVLSTNLLHPPEQWLRFGAACSNRRDDECIHHLLKPRPHDANSPYTATG